MRRFVLALLAAAAPLGAAAGDTRSIALVVTGADGAFVPGIRAEEVRVLENGEPRELLAMEPDERPLAVALVLDTSTGAARVFRGRRSTPCGPSSPGCPRGRSARCGRPGITRGRSAS